MASEQAYRKKLSLDGGYSKDNVKRFLQGKDIKTNINLINFAKIDRYSLHLHIIFEKLFKILPEEIRPNWNDFKETIDDANSVFHAHPELLLRLNNHGRNYEDVYYDWLLGESIIKFFTNALAYIFQTDATNIIKIGHDNIHDIEHFERTGDADLQITINNQVLNLEIQSGLADANDIKMHKINQAKIKSRNGITTFVIHFDLFNGRTAFINISSISDDDINWYENPRFEGQNVIRIPASDFIWELDSLPPLYNSNTKTFEYNN